MRAVVCDRYGPPDVLRLDEVGRPEPKDGEVLVRRSPSSPSGTRSSVLTRGRSARTRSLSACRPAA